MNDAREDFLKIENRIDSDIYGLWLHLHPNTNINEIEKHFHSWNAEGDNAVDFIIVSCCFLDWDFQNENRQLTYTIKMFGNKKYSNTMYNLTEKSFEFSPIIAKVANEFPNHIVVNGEELTSIENTYTYSEGRIYTPTSKETGEIKLIADNVFTCPVKITDKGVSYQKEIINPYPYSELTIL